MSLRVHARRFFCNNLRRKRAIFCERLPEIASYARKTDRLEEALLLILLAVLVGGGRIVLFELRFAFRRGLRNDLAARSLPVDVASAGGERNARRSETSLPDVLHSTASSIFGLRSLE